MTEFLIFFLNRARNLKTSTSSNSRVLNTNVVSVFVNSQNFSHFWTFLAKMAEFFKFIQNRALNLKTSTSSNSRMLNPNVVLGFENSQNFSHFLNFFCFFCS